jgi:hypothetical protein
MLTNSSGEISFERRAPKTVHTVHLVCVLIFSLVVINSACGQTAAHTNATVAVKKKTSHWKVYVNRNYGFSFRYPRQYSPETKASNNRYKKFELHLVTLTQIDPDIQILVALIDEPFDLQNLVRIGAPTGVEYPPAAMRIGRYTFYWYGPGGGGVDYPDRYFVNLKGKTLLIDFYGPYSSESKTPSQETKDLEPQILATFQLLRREQ